MNVPKFLPTGRALHGAAVVQLRTYQGKTKEKEGCSVGIRTTLTDSLEHGPNFVANSFQISASSSKVSLPSNTTAKTFA